MELVNLYKEKYTMVPLGRMLFAGLIFLGSQCNLLISSSRGLHESIAQEMSEGK